MGRMAEEERTRKDLERLARFRVLDDTFMRQVFKDQRELTQHVLRVLTSIRGLVLVDHETQRDLKRLVGSKSVVLDVWGTDPKGTQYDMEVQSGSDLDPLRFRYYGSAMDVEALPAGADYGDLPERWLIVVLECDPDGPERKLRHYRMREEGDGTSADVPLADGAHLIYVNAAWRGNDEIGSLMSDFCQSDPAQIHDAMLRERVQYLKTDPEGVREMCRISDEIYNEGIEQGIEQGIAQGARGNLLANVRSLMSSVGWTAHEALDALQVPESERKDVLAELQTPVSAD
ncbi:MAG: hypothetical protein IKF14_01880 [Atopobiaceae bacterium]|nr:hypothetical protein [Atopobiaceae bacterium]